ncbi:breast cancer type 2 susceptibility protein homolog isoform X2 [Anthonomus grandis grandis]|nr:breast cancer type 2 susceptibility protein homolog isoform X2 [Anthonomus grandis grandis]
MIYGAEIVNCQGCYPLEAPENVYLKINYNATRRAVWWCKLGCQKFSGPFLIPMSSIHLAGGKIGCIKCYILRIYPIKYLEKCGNENVWRNEKAEERQAEAYQNACSSNTRSRNQETVRDIKNITNPEQLYNMLQQTQDVESFQEIMSATQKSAVYQYSICKSFNNSKSVQSRNVTPVLKMKISNVEGEPTKILDFFVWRPTEEHLLELREDEVVTIYDLSCSGKWGLSANKTTIFRRDKKPKDDALKKFTRKVTSISRLTTFSRDSCLNEFDTVGLVVKKMIREDLQQVWMTDTHQSLLLVRITEGPKTVLVLDNVTEGETVSVCNLQFKHAYKTHTVSEGDHFITFSKYPKYLHLKDALEVLNTELATLKKDELIQKCLDKISNLDVNGDNKQIQSPLDTDEMESSQITSTDIALLECIDRII